MLISWELLVGLLGTAPALADDSVAFRSPTGNVHCFIDQWGGGAKVRCDLIALVQTYRSAPPDCENDCGFAFGLEDRGRGYLACVVETEVNRRNPGLP